jgi:hypothetical protein
MRNSILIVLIWQFICLSINAQNAPKAEFKDRVAFKNGNVFYGKLLLVVPNDSLVFEFPSGNEATFRYADIKKITMATPPKAAVSIEKPYHFREKGLYGVVAYANSIGKSAGSIRGGVGASAVVGWKFNRLVGVGVGAAYDHLYLANGDAPVLSVFSEWRGYLQAKPKSEYFSLAAGFAQPLRQKGNNYSELNAGFMLQPTFGYRFGASSRYNFFADFGARFQRVGMQTLNQWSENNYTVTYQRWILRGGIVF